MIVMATLKPISLFISWSNSGLAPREISRRAPRGGAFIVGSFLVRGGGLYCWLVAPFGGLVNRKTPSVGMILDH